MTSSISPEPHPATPLGSPLERSAAWIWACLCLAIFFLPGASGTVVAIACIAASAIGLLQHGSVPKPEGAYAWFYAFSAAIAIRLAIPPFGEEDVPFGAGLHRIAMLLGFLAAFAFLYGAVEFRRILATIFVITVAFSAISIGAYILGGAETSRMPFIGRTTNKIVGATGAGVGVIAAATLVLFYSEQLSRRVILAIGAGAFLNIGAMYLSGSRGPLLSLLLASVAGAFLVRLRSGWVLFAAAMAISGALTAVVVFEDEIKSALCPLTRLACRPSHRQDVWSESVRLILDHPWLGMGFKFRFDNNVVPHAHNAFLGVALFYGLPILAIFLAMLARIATALNALASSGERAFALVTFLFALGAVASDLSDPLRFLGMHYLYFWLPICIALVGTKNTDVRSSAR